MLGSRLRQTDIIALGDLLLRPFVAPPSPVLGSDGPLFSLLLFRLLTYWIVTLRVSSRRTCLGRPSLPTKLAIIPTDRLIDLFLWENLQFFLIPGDVRRDAPAPFYRARQR